MQAIQTTTIYWLVAISVLTSIIASYGAFSFAARAADMPSRRSRPWLIGAALTMGFGIWCMHYMAMLSMPMPMQVYYHVPTVLLSLAVAVVGAGLGFSLVGTEFSTKLPGVFRIVLAGTLLGSGLGGMHYLGMAAMRLPAVFVYQRGLIVASVCLSLPVSCAALWIAFAMRPKATSRDVLRIFGGLVMGLGIIGVHYLGLAAVHIRPANVVVQTHRSVHVTSLSVASGLLTIGLVLFGAVTTMIFDRKNYTRMQANNRRLRKVRLQLRKSEQELRDANARLVELSMRDGLTGVYNRRHFEDTLDAEWRRSLRTRSRLAMLLVDIDHFKVLNDTYGHRAGDECLRQVAICLKQSLHRPGDTLARYGGEEFVAILPGADAAGAMQVAEAMRSAIEKLKVRLGGVSSPPGVTVSVGVCSHGPIPGSVPASLLAAADEALYRAKADGRNCIRVS